MKPAFTGGCACGAVRFEAAAQPSAFVVCHCRDCQRAGGGAPAYALALRRADVVVTKGEDKINTYEVTSDAGSKVFRSFCGDCGTHLFAGNDANPDFMGVKASALDDPSWLVPSMTIWTSSAQPWAHIDPDIPQYAGDFDGYRE